MQKIKTSEIPKTVKLTSSLCEMFKNIGCVVNMDNIYSSPELYIKVFGMGMYARWIVRANRKYLPSIIQFKKPDMKNIARGSFRFATNEKYNVSCYVTTTSVFILYSTYLTQLNHNDKAEYQENRGSPESVDSKIVFDDEESPIILGEPMFPHDDWVVVNQKLKYSGWSWSNRYDLISFSYMKLGIREIKEKRLNVDYFTEEDHVKEYA